MNFLKKWLFKREISKIKRISDLEKQIDEELKDSALEYQRIIREAAKMNRLKEQQRRIKRVREEVFDADSDDDTDDDYEDDDSDDDTDDDITKQVTKAFLDKILSPTSAAQGITSSKIGLTDEELEYGRQLFEQYKKTKK